jgi:hypothetical protein
MAAMFLYAQCVVLKYDGISGFFDPSRSNRTNRDISFKRERYVDMAGFIIWSQSEASALYDVRYDS